MDPPGRTDDARGGAAPPDETRSATTTSPAVGPSAMRERRTIGRFYVLEELGSGGMGVVFAAYDPALDRKVAIKLLRRDRGVGDAAQGRARLVSEAQAMARLSHPHVVTVHEVAFDLDAAYLVMEYVAGPTLRGWLDERERSWTEVLAMFLGAGEGLAAAHREGIVHRDFKPANVLVDRDGRARVGDFGLAAVVEDEAPAVGSGGVAGTLPYMAPEQLRGELYDARADQFAYCVALWEGLHGTRPFAGNTRDELDAAIRAGVFVEPVRKPPDWVRAAILRGLAVDPAARWPSLDALRAALRRDPRVIRRRIAGATALIAIAAGALWVTWPSVEAVDPCAGAAARFAGVWDVARKVEVHAAFAATGLGYGEDTWRAVRDRLDHYASAWRDMSTEACRATRVEGRQSDTLMDLRMGCLDQRRRVLGALSALWAQGVDGDALAHAIDAASQLPPLSDCADARALRDRAPPPSNPLQARMIAPARAQLDAVEALMLAHRLPDAKRAAPAARAAADATGWDAIRADQAFVEGETLSLLAEPGAEARLLDAHHLAEAARDDRLRARVLIRLVSDLASSQQKPDAALRVADLADGVVARLGDDELRGRLLRMRGKALLAAGKYSEARAVFTDARARLTRTVGAADAATVATVADLAQCSSIQGDHATARRLYDENLAVALPALGAEHPSVAQLMATLANSLVDAGDAKAAVPIFRRSLAILEHSFGPDGGPIAGTLHNLARAEYMLQHRDESRRLYERALAIRERAFGRDSLVTASTLGSVALARADARQFEPAIRDLERVLAIKLKALGPAHSRVGAAYEQLAEVLQASGDYPRALDGFRHALEIRRAALGADHGQTLRSIGAIGQVLGQLHRCREAMPQLARAIDALSKDDREPAAVVEDLLAAARCELDDHQPALALARGERALTVIDKHDLGDVTRGHVDWMRARALSALRRGEPAIAAARKAEHELAGDVFSAPVLAQVRAWLAAHPG